MRTAGLTPSGTPSAVFQARSLAQRRVMWRVIPTTALLKILLC